jgi:hypothetical protein
MAGVEGHRTVLDHGDHPGADLDRVVEVEITNMILSADFADDADYNLLQKSVKSV